MGPESRWQAFGPGADRPVDPARLAAGPCPRTTLRIEGGAARLRDAHLARLLAGLAHRSEAAPWLPAAFEAALSQAQDGILRARVSPAEEVLMVRWEPWRPPSEPWRLLAVPHPLGDLRGQTAAEHKGLLGGWSEAALGLARSQGAHDVLCLWPDGTVAETALAAVALPCGDHLRLPPAEGRVSSLAEAHLLPDWAAERGLSLRRGPVTLEEALARGLRCFNAARGVWQAEVLAPPVP
jgi:branched-subunit amino acid aminotransferase/4-amino-4-deoxychorismate lyase